MVETIQPQRLAGVSAMQKFSHFIPKGLKLSSSLHPAQRN